MIKVAVSVPVLFFNDLNSSNVNTKKCLNVLYTNSDCLSQTKLVVISNYCDQNSLDIIAITEILPKFSLFQPEEKNYSLDFYTSMWQNIQDSKQVKLHHCWT